MSLWNWDLKKIIFLKSRLLPFYKYRQGRYTNFPWKIFGNHAVCWTFSVANKSGHFSFGSFCVISFTTQGFLWFLGNQCSRDRVVQCWRLRGFSVQRIYYANRSSNRFLSAASAVLLLPSCVQPLTLHSETFCVPWTQIRVNSAFLGRLFCTGKQQFWRNK